MTDMKKPRILLVDDAEEIASLCKRILEKNGYDVTLHSSSREAFEAFRNAPEDFDIVVTDLDMPELTGIEMAAEMLKVKSDTPFVLSTGYSIDIPENIEEYGFRELLIKPFSPMDLVKTVNAILHNHE